MCIYLTIYLDEYWERRQCARQQGQIEHPRMAYSGSFGSPLGSEDTNMNTKLRSARCTLLIGLLAASCLWASSSGIAQPAPPTNTILPLETWSFSDTNTWMSDHKRTPISFTNLGVSLLGDGTSLVVDSSSPAWLDYNVFNSDGTTNLVVGNPGSLLFWYAPDWASVSQGGSGPGVYGRMIEVGSYTTNASYGWWSVYVDDVGSNIYFSAQDDAGSETNYLTAPISWTTNFWHQVVLNYSSTNTALFIDSTNITNGPGVTIYPSLNVQSNGFCIGSDGLATGLLQAHGIFDDLSTYNCELDSNTIIQNYVDLAVYYYLNPANIANLHQGPSSPATVPVFDAITGPGYLVAVSTNTSGCTTSSNVWLTNTLAAVATNGVNLTFTIAGGSNGLAYDVFATPAIEYPATNATWTWMGQGSQCVSYTITNLTNGAVFLVLGTPQDSYTNGLTDAYELLVLHKNPAIPSGDGMLDGWKVLWGMNPNINNSALSTERENYVYDGTGRLKSVSGINAELFNFDPEGNIQLDQQ